MAQGRPDRPQLDAREGAEHRERVAATIRADVAALTEHPDRAAGGPGHVAARRLLAARAAELGLMPYHGPSFAPSDEGGVSNVLAMVPGADRHRRPVVLATNLDTAPGARGAGANAAAAAVMLAAVPRLLDAGLERGVLLAFLDAGAAIGDTRGGGARALLERQRHHDVKAALVLDRLGHRASGALAGALAVTGAETDARLPALIASLEARPRLLPVHRRYRRGPLPSDAFHAAAVPYLELCGGASHLHGGADDGASALDYDLLPQVVEVVVELVGKLDGARLPGPFEVTDTLEFELDALVRHLGPGGDGRAAVAPARSAVDRAVAPLLAALGDRSEPPRPPIA